MEQNGASQGKKSIDKIIEHMTADIHNSDGQYIQLGFTPPHTPASHQHWADYSMHSPSANHFAPVQAQSSNENSVFMPDLSMRYDIHTAMHMSKSGDMPQNHSMYYTTTRQQINSMPQNNEMLGTVVDSGGNVVNVVYNSPQSQNTSSLSQSFILHRDSMRDNIQHQFGGFMPYHQPNIAETNKLNQNTDYNIFSNDIQRQPQQPSHVQYQEQIATNNRVQLIENLVGNWVPNQSGTYSPFGIIDTEKKMPPSTNQQGIQTSPSLINSNIDQRSLVGRNSRKNRIVAEVRPMRPSYSDVLAKSAPSPTPVANTSKQNIANQNFANKLDFGVKTIKSNSTPKNSAKKSKNAVLKRQHSSGSDDQNMNTSKTSTQTTKPVRSPEANRKSKSTSKHALGTMSRKWVSLDDLDTESGSMDQVFDTGSTLRKHSGLRSPDHDGSGKKTNSSGKGKPSISQDERWYSVGSNTLNNHKPAGYGSGGRGSGFSNTAAKRPPIHINNLGPTPWAAVRNNNVGCNSGSSAGEKNFLKTVVGNSKNCKSPIEEKKENVNLSSTNLRNEGKTNLSGRTSSSGRNSSGSFSQTPSPIAEKKRGQRSKKKDYGSPIKRKNSSAEEDSGSRFKDGYLLGLEHNITMPTTGDEAMKRLLACKGKDPYSILGVTPHCTDDDVKKYYKRQAFLVHPDKNNQPGAEEAFKILVHAFELIGEPERRKAYDRRVAETQQVEQVWSELSDLLSQLHQKMEYAAKTIRCTNCGKRHRRTNVHRPCYAARMCTQCKIRHSAREGDIWAESTFFGFIWHYYACMDGSVYDITEWANCQSENLRHLKANSHTVQYRIVLGRQQGQQNQQQSPPSQHHHHHHHRNRGHNHTDSNSDADFEDFLSTLYGHSGSGGSSEGAGRGDLGRGRRKGKRKK